MCDLIFVYICDNDLVPKFNLFFYTYYVSAIRLSHRENFEHVSYVQNN